MGGVGLSVEGGKECVCLGVGVGEWIHEKGAFLVLGGLSRGWWGEGGGGGGGVSLDIPWDSSMFLRHYLYQP